VGAAMRIEMGFVMIRVDEEETITEQEEAVIDIIEEKKGEKEEAEERRCGMNRLNVMYMMYTTYSI
jgi:hypothetical protein